MTPILRIRIRCVHHAGDHNLISGIVGSVEDGATALSCAKGAMPTGRLMCSCPRQTGTHTEQRTVMRDTQQQATVRANKL